MLTCGNYEIWRCKKLPLFDPGPVPTSRNQPDNPTMADKAMQRRRSRASQESSQQESQPSLLGDESQDAASSPRFARSGMSQDFFDALNFDADDISALPDDSVAALSVGIVAVMSRPSTNKRQKEIKPFALQKCFYACPKHMSDEQKEKVKARIEKDITDFKYQKYKVEIHRFGLPFVVEEICCISTGYNLVPKILKAPPPASTEIKTEKKRRRNASDDEDGKDEDGKGDDEEDDAYVPKGSKAKKSKGDDEEDEGAVTTASRSLRSQRK